MDDHDRTEGSSALDEESLKWARRLLIVVRNKNKKTISVSYAFEMDEIPVKVIACDEKWFEFEQVYLRADHIDLRDIRDCISRPKKGVLRKLEEYYAHSPAEFSKFFYEYYIIPANAQNPKCFNTRKPRGTYYGLKPVEMYEIRIAAAQVYVYLKHWVVEKGPSEIVPWEFMALNDRYRIQPREVLSTTWELVEEHFRIGILKIRNEKTFYNNFIIQGHLLKTFERAFSLFDYAPIGLPDGLVYPAWAKPLLEVLESARRRPQE